MFCCMFIRNYNLLVCKHFVVVMEYYVNTTNIYVARVINWYFFTLLIEIIDNNNKNNNNRLYFES